MFLQLNPVLPVRVVAHPGWEGPVGPAMAVGWLKLHTEHNLIWIVIFDQNGQIREIESPGIRARSNVTWGRPKPER